MGDVHPPLTSFPIVLITLTLAAELAALRRPEEIYRRLGFLLLALLAILAPLTYYSGFWASESASRSFSVPQEAIAYHQSYALLFLGSVYVTLLLRWLSDVAVHGKRLFTALYLLSLLASVALVLLTGAGGGKLVFTYGAGVQLN